MKASFNVLTEPWIPTLDQEGVTRELGLLEVLERAHELQTVRSASPLVEYSVYRFLIVFLMDMIRPKDIDTLGNLLEEERFDPDMVTAYIEMCEQEGVSFDLFDSERPFLQVPYVEAWDRQAKPVSTLDYTVPNGNNVIHFDHRRSEIRYTPGEALRMLLTAQLFCTAGAQGYPSHVNGAPPWFALIHGENLFQTLIFGMIGTDDIAISFDDPPVFWRNRGEVPSKELVPSTSWLYGMLLPARRIHLLPDDDGKTVSQVHFSQGLNYKNETNAWTDPHVTYEITSKGRSNWKPKDNEAIWKNLYLLIADTSEPQILRQRMKIVSVVSEEVHVVLYGVEVESGQAKYLLQQRCDLRLPLNLIENVDAIRFIRWYVTSATRLGKALYHSLNDVGKTKKNGKKEKTGIEIEVERQFYADCEWILWPLLSIISQPSCDLNELRQQIVEKLIQAATDHANKVLQNQTLRGRAMLSLMKKQQAILHKECEKIRKEALLC